MISRISDPMSTSLPPDVIQAAILECIRRGWIEVVHFDDGIDRYRITDAGAKHLEGVIGDREDEV